MQVISIFNLLNAHNATLLQSLVFFYILLYTDESQAANPWVWKMIIQTYKTEIFQMDIWATEVHADLMEASFWHYFD